jgi:hypothetical protein
LVSNRASPAGASPVDTTADTGVSASSTRPYSSSRTSLSSWSTEGVPTCVRSAAGCGVAQVVGSGASGAGSGDTSSVAAGDEGSPTSAAIMSSSTGTAVFVGGGASHERPGASTGGAAGAFQVANPGSSEGSAVFGGSAIWSANGGTVDVVANGERSDEFVGADVTGRRNPQLVQNFAPSRFWAAQFGQRFIGSGLIQRTNRRASNAATRVHELRLPSSIARPCMDRYCQSAATDPTGDCGLSRSRGEPSGVSTKS